MEDPCTVAQVEDSVWSLGDGQIEAGLGRIEIDGQRKSRDDGIFARSTLRPGN